MNESFVQTPNHETANNSLTMTMTNQQFQDLSGTFETDHGEQSHNSELDSYIHTLEKECIPTESVQANSDNQSSNPKNLPKKILTQPPSSTQNDIEHVLRAVNNNIRRLCMSLPDMSIEPSQISDECKYMKEDIIHMIDAVEQAYIKDFENRKEAARLEAERLEREKLEKEIIERERIEQERLEQERLEKERQEALRKEQTRLEEEARIAAEKAKLAEFIQNALEVAIKMKEEQEDLRRNADANQQKNEDVFKQLFAMLNEKFDKIEARLPPPP